MGKLFIGCDPGKSGGIVALNADGGIHLAEKMPDTDMGVWDLFEQLALVDALDGNMVAVIEKVWAMPSGSGAAMGVSSAFSFGMGYGALKMALTGNGIPFTEVPPRKWQESMGCSLSGKTPKTEKKNHNKAVAQKLFPDVKVTHNLADALLIASYARRVSTF